MGNKNKPSITSVATHSSVFMERFMYNADEPGKQPQHTTLKRTLQTVVLFDDLGSGLNNPGVIL